MFQTLGAVESLGVTGCKTPGLRKISFHIRVIPCQFMQNFEIFELLSLIFFLLIYVVVLIKKMIQFKFELIWMNSYGNIEVLLQAVLHIFKPARNPFLIIS